MKNREDQIRERAHQIWEQEGRPEGQQQAHWHRATREIDGDGGQTGVNDDPSAAPPQKQGDHRATPVDTPGTGSAD